MTHRDDIGFNRNYRFWLSREGLGGHGTGVIVMLNPSTADQHTDDPTIRRCMRFAGREGYHSLIVVNLYGLRATNPADLWSHPDPVGQMTANEAGNDVAIGTAISQAGRYGDGRVIVAWGAHARQDRVDEFKAIVDRARAPVTLWCLGTTKDGAPRHPLYVRGDQPLTPWPAEVGACEL